MNNTNTKELQVIEKSLSPLAEQATSLSIETEADLKVGVELLSRLNQYNDKMVQEREKVTKPLNAALKAERARWKPLESLHEEAISHIRTEMTRYQTELTNKRKADEEAIASRIGDGRGHLKVETAVKKLENLPTIETEHATEAGLVQFRQKKQLKITNLELVRKFHEYFDLNESKLLEDLKSGKLVPGAEIEIVSVPVNYR